MTEARARGAALVPLGLVLAALASAGQSARQEGDAWVFHDPLPPDAELAARAEGLARPGCASCHAEIADEWAASMHGLAWIDPRYEAALAEVQRKESCYGCHAPLPLLAADPAAPPRKPEPRDEALEPRRFGVSCKSCHQGEEKDIVLGPFGIPTDAHPSRLSERFTPAGSNALCLACHSTTIGPVIGIGKDFEAARLAERGESCVGCHMAPLERSIATDDDDLPTPARHGRSHWLQTPRDPRFLAQAFALEPLEVQGGTTLVRLKNRAGHRVPGLVDRRLELVAIALGPTGQELARASATLDTRSFLALDGTLELRLPAEAAEVRVTGLHHAPGMPEPVPFLDVRARASSER